MMMAGSGILSLMGWYIDEKLFGNGTSLILTAGILCSYVLKPFRMGICHGTNERRHGNDGGSEDDRQGTARPSS